MPQSFGVGIDLFLPPEILPFPKLTAVVTNALPPAAVTGTAVFFGK